MFEFVSEWVKHNKLYDLLFYDITPVVNKEGYYICVPGKNAPILNENDIRWWKTKLAPHHRLIYYVDEEQKRNCTGTAQVQYAFFYINPAALWHGWGSYLCENPNENTEKITKDLSRQLTHRYRLLLENNETG